MWHHRVGLISLSSMLAVAGLALLVAAPVVAGDPCYHGFEMPARTVDTDPQVKLAPCAFVPTVTIIPVGGTVTFFNGNGPTHLITGQPGVGLTRRRAPTQRHRFLYVRQGRHVPLRVRPPSRDVGAIVVGDAATALAVTDESGGVHATGAEVSTASTGADVSDGVVLAAGTALGALAGMAVTAAALLRRRTSVVKEPLGSN